MNMRQIELSTTLSSWKDRSCEREGEYEREKGEGAAEGEGEGEGEGETKFILCLQRHAH